MQELPTTGDTGETPVPLSVEDIASLADDDVAPQALAQKLLDYALGYNADWIDVEALGVDPMPTDNSSYNRIILDIPSKPQEKNYYCGPATTQQVLAYLGVTKSQSTLASDQHLGTEASKATYFPRVKKVLNKLVDETYTRSVVKDTTDMINYLNYGWSHNQPGAYHVMLHAQFFSYLAKDHGGTFKQAPAGESLATRIGGASLSPTMRQAGPMATRLPVTSR